jgi:hypothetical protein
MVHLAVLSCVIHASDCQDIYLPDVQYRESYRASWQRPVEPNHQALTPDHEMFLLAPLSNAEFVVARRNSVAHMPIARSDRHLFFRKCVFIPCWKQGRNDAALLAQSGMPSQLKTQDVWFSPSVI